MIHYLNLCDTTYNDSINTSQRLAAISHGCGQFHPQILWANLPTPVMHRLCKTAVNVRVNVPDRASRTS
jgi:hypothetical protein